MRCCVPFCRSSTDNAAGADEVTFHGFPSDATLHMKWLSALGKHGQPIKGSAVVCSRHFLADDFYNKEGGSKQVRFGVVPSTIKLCIICLDTDRYVVSLSKYNLEEAYEKLTGHSICREGYLKQTLCIECTQHLINFEKFRSKSLKARSAMLDLIKMHDTVTMQHIKNINYIREQLKTEMVRTTFAPDYCNLHIIEHNYGDVQKDPGNIVVPDAVKIEDYEYTLVESDIVVKLEETNEDNGEVNIESRDSTECINNVSDANTLLEKKLMDEALSGELDLDEAIKAEDSGCSDDGHKDNTHHAQSGSEECDTKLAQRTHTSQYSQQREPNQAWGDDPSADYPHSSVKLLPRPLYELASEKNEELCKNRSIASEPEGGEPTNSLTLEKLFSCNSCDYACRRKDSLIRHMRIHTGEKPFSCNYCEYAFSTKDKLTSHMRIHTGEKPFSCNSCDFACRRKANLLIHMTIHTGEKPFSCELCEYACRRKGDLVSHMRIHTGDKPFSCKLCEYACRQKEKLVRHMRIHTGEKPFSCKLCQYACRQKGNLVSHMRIHTGEKPFSCKLCEYACKQKESLLSHMRIHTGEKPFSCKLCEYASRTKGDLVRHTRIHTGEKPFSCKFCEYACRTKDKLTRHTKIHTGEKPFSCNSCDFASRRKENLLSHMTIHTGDNPYSCNLCHYACRQKEQLTRHMRVHSDEKPFSCKLCEYACKRKSDLVRHTRIHTGEKPFSCKLCEYACRAKGDLVNHMKIHRDDTTVT